MYPVNINPKLELIEKINTCKFVQWLNADMCNGFRGGSKYVCAHFKVNGKDGGNGDGSFSIVFIKLINYPDALFWAISEHEDGVYNRVTKEHDGKRGYFIDKDTPVIGGNSPITEGIIFIPVSECKYAEVPEEEFFL